MVVAVLLLVLIAVLVATLARRNANKARWAAAAAELGLEVSPSFGQLQMLGRGLTVVKDSATTTYIFEGLPWDLTIQSAGSISRPPVSVGDDLFDARVRIRGAEEDVVAWLDAASRRRLVELGSTVRIEWGKLIVRINGLGVEVVETARAVIALGERLAQPARKKLLLENALRDPVAGVRGRNLEVLAAKFLDSEEARTAARAGLDDDAAEVRLAAARIERSDKALAALRGIVVDARLDPALRSAALERLVRQHGYDRAKDLVPAALAQRAPILRQAAAAAAGEARDLDQLERLCEAMRDQPPAEIKEVVAALGKLGDARAEPALIGLLAGGDDAVRAAAARALGVLGTVRAVEPLLPLTKGLLDRELHAAARDAVRRIQERLGDAEAGRLSIAAEGPAGALSMTTEGGELSLPDRVKE